jgi:membrane protein implicated in regulation of membrane protease activity
MNGFSVTDLTRILRWMGTTVLILLAVLILVSALIWLLRRMAQQQVAQPDLDLIGHEAIVTRMIRPRKQGKIRCKVNNLTVTLAATSAAPIPAGRRVLITAMDQGVARVLIKEDKPNA